MTNKEAIKRIQDIIIYTGLTIPTSLNDIEALKMAIKALEIVDDVNHSRGDEK